jgi:drug/metabolite transporter (DMT)-like permease
VTNLARGALPLLGFAAFTAALDVYAGNQLQAHSPVTLAAVSFALATTFFLGLDIARRGPAAILRGLRRNRSDVIALNLTTAVTWLSMLYALKFLEPAVVNAVGLALGPVFTLVLSPLIRPGTSVLKREVWVSLGIGALIVSLAWGSVTGRSAVGMIGTTDALIGLVLTVVTAAAGTGNVIYSKRLSEAGYSPQSVLAIRFFLMVAVTWGFLALSANVDLGGALRPGAVLAVIGVGLPLYLLQVGIKHTEPITASLLTTLSPIFAFLLQILDRRLTPSLLTLAGIVGITALVAIGTLARKDSKS